MDQFINQMPEEEEAQRDKYLTFTLGADSFGIEIKYVTEIISIKPITSVPNAPKYIRGIINLRGKIIAVIDMGLRFEKEQSQYNDRTCIIIVNINEVEVGLIVDCVAEVIKIAVKDVILTPNEKLVEKNKYIRGMGKVNNKIKLIINTERLLEEASN